MAVFIQCNHGGKLNEFEVEVLSGCLFLFFFCENKNGQALERHLSSN